MPLSIEQSERYVGNDHWQWSVWLNGNPDELDSIDHVVYILHSTYINPVRRVADRATNFRLETSGWGAFTIHANIVHQDGHETALKRDLVLLYPDGTPTLA